MTFLPDPDLSTAGVLAALRDSGHPLREWGKAMDGTPMLAAQTGGTKQPAIFITAGVHCTETAGIHAALHLLDTLETEHEVHVLPMRDPVGFAGLHHCLSLAAGDDVHIDSPEASLAFLRERAQLLWSEGDLSLFLLGDVGFLWGAPRPGLDTFWRQLNAGPYSLPNEAPDLVAALRGKHVFFLNSTSTIEGSGDLQRCYHTFTDTSGWWESLNRFFGQDDAPPEVVAVDRIIQTIRPGLTMDLHEGNGRGFWIPSPRPDRDEDAELVLEMTRAFFSYIEERSYPIETYEQWLESNGIEGRAPGYMRREPRLEGLFWVYQELDQGPNLSSYQSRTGIASGTEGPMIQPLAMRVDGITNGTRRAIKVWETAQ